jgi:radical SAM superfamily enzyme YgiQ (UPF0313 family)
MDAIAEAILERSPDVLGVSLTSRQWLRAREVFTGIRSRLDIPVIAGGLLPTFASDAILEADGFDCVCIGEGEEALREFLDAMEAGSTVNKDRIANIRTKNERNFRLRPPVSHLDDLPFMDRRLLEEQNGVRHMLTRRGCPYSCTYCASAALNDLYGGKRFLRRRSPQNVVQELESLKDNDPLSYVIFVDDTFTLDRQWLREFCKLYTLRIGAAFSIHARVETMDEEIIKQLALAGCMHITYGVESGSERVRKEIMNRPVSNRQIREVFQITKKAGIIATANYMMGLPGETAEDVEKTIALNEAIQPDDFGFFVFYPYPGTRLFSVCRNSGYLPPDFMDLPANNRETILRLPDLTGNDIDDFYQRFTEARINGYLRKYGECFPETGKEKIRKEFEKSAAMG